MCESGFAIWRAALPIFLQRQVPNSKTFSAFWNLEQKGFQNINFHNIYRELLALVCCLVMQFNSPFTQVCHVLLLETKNTTVLASCQPVSSATFIWQKAHRIAALLCKWTWLKYYYLLCPSYATQKK